MNEKKIVEMLKSWDTVQLNSAFDIIKHQPFVNLRRLNSYSLAVTPLGTSVIVSESPGEFHTQCNDDLNHQINC